MVSQSPIAAPDAPPPAGSPGLSRRQWLEQLFDRPLALHRRLIDVSGALPAAVILAQSLYWTRVGKTDDGWFWKTAEQWELETGLTRRQQTGARSTLRERQLVEERRVGVPPIIWIRVDFPALGRALALPELSLPPGMLPAAAADGLRLWLGESLAVPPLLIHRLGSIPAALLLAHLLQSQRQRGDFASVMTLPTRELQQQLGLTLRESQSARRKLRDSGLIKDWLHGTPPQVHVRLLWQALPDWLNTSAAPPPAKPAAAPRQMEMPWFSAVGAGTRPTPEIANSHAKSLISPNYAFLFNRQTEIPAGDRAANFAAGPASTLIPPSAVPEIDAKSLNLLNYAELFNKQPANAAPIEQKRIINLHKSAKLIIKKTTNNKNHHYTPLPPAVTESSAGGGGANPETQPPPLLHWPASFDLAQQAQARQLLDRMEVPHNVRQTLLDEVAGRIRFGQKGQGKAVHNALGLLRHLAQLAGTDAFVPEVASQEAARRERAQAQQAALAASEAAASSEADQPQPGTAEAPAIDGLQWIQRVREQLK